MTKVNFLIMSLMQHETGYYVNCIVSLT